MQLQTVNRSDAEKIFGAFTNAQGATMTTGYAVCLATAVASVNGINAVLPATAHLRTFAGICVSDVPDNQVGLFQSYGYNGSVFYFAEATSASLTAPDVALGPGPASLGVGATGLSFTQGPVVLLNSVGAVIRSAGGYVTGFIKAM